MIMKHDIVAWEWKSGRDTVGIVILRDEFTKKLKGYIGVAKGLDEKVDVEYIADWGARLTAKEALPFFSQFSEEDFE